MLDTDVLTDPFLFKDLYWPDVQFYDKQAEIINSVRDNYITVVPAGNKLGKDFISAFIGLHFFCSRQPARVITSSVDGNQLDGVLWGEIRNFIRTAAHPLPIIENHLKLRQLMPDGSRHGQSEMIGRVVDKGEGLLGRHLPHGPKMQPRVLAIIDEASGFDDENFKPVDTWAHRILIIGNPFPCENFFKRFVKGGDIKSKFGPGNRVKVIHICAEDSPSVKRARIQESKGITPDNKIVVPGCMDYYDYMERREHHDPILQTIGLDGQFYEGEDVKLYPPKWLATSMKRAKFLRRMEQAGKIVRNTKSLGVDAAEGGDDTSFTGVDDYGITKKQTYKTPDTSVIGGRTIVWIRQEDVPANQVLFDRGGGGKQHADYLRMQGFPVRTVGFGERPTASEKTKELKTDEEKDESIELKYTYKNRRAEMYGLLRNLLDPSLNEFVFAIDEKFTELLRQMSLIPLLYDAEGRVYLPPKNKPHSTFKGDTIQKLVGHSPDELDSLVLAVYGMVYPQTQVQISAIAI